MAADRAERGGLDVDAWLERFRALGRREPLRFPSDAIPSHFKKSAVLILFWEEEGGLRTLLTRRPSHMSRHAGEIAFAGGLVEAGESFQLAAVREAHEEVGLDPASVEVVGRLDDAWSGSGSLLVSHVGLVPSRPTFSPQPAEVDEILTPDVRDLLRPEARRQQVVDSRGVRYVNEMIDFPGGAVFGLTADLLLEALEWGKGGAPHRGPARLRDLITYHRG